jgi:hypothetical protein
MAPELLLEEAETVPPSAMQELTVQPVQSPKSVPSKESDIYALGMVVFEVSFTRSVLFWMIRYCHIVGHNWKHPI